MQRRTRVLLLSIATAVWVTYVVLIAYEYAHAKGYEVPSPAVHIHALAEQCRKIFEAIGRQVARLLDIWWYIEELLGGIAKAAYRVTLELGGLSLSWVWFIWGWVKEATGHPRVALGTATCSILLLLFIDYKYGVIRGPAMHWWAELEAYNKAWEAKAVAQGLEEKAFKRAARKRAEGTDDSDWIKESRGEKKA